MQFNKRKYIECGKTYSVECTEASEKENSNGSYIELTLSDLDGGGEIRDFLSSSFGEKEESLLKLFGLEGEEGVFEPQIFHGEKFEIKTVRGKKMNSAENKTEDELTDYDFFPRIVKYLPIKKNDK